MKIKSFSVKNYRSITNAEKLKLGQLTVLIGPNNEGKSNILRALVLGLEILSSIDVARKFKMRYSLRSSNELASYDWDRDFPLSKQADDRKGITIFDFDFDLTEEEKTSFQTATGTNIKGILPVRITIDAHSNISFNFRKRGRYTPKISKKRDEICSFIRENIAYEYVASVRTAESAMKVADELLSQELKTIENDPAFVSAMATIERLQSTVLKNASKTLTSVLKQFLPDVQSVSVSVNSADRIRAMRQHCEIDVDDGTTTNLRHKGDGVQSLASIAMIRHASESGAKGRQLLLAIEEPETHLHPEAIQELKQIIVGLAKSHQVILTTHNPVLVNRAEIGGNIIVEDHRARSANSIKEIRDCLGVHLSDNLQSAELVLLLEGEEDIKPIDKLLRYHSTALTVALDNGRLAIDTLAGASKLIYKLGLFRAAGCRYHVYMDNDKAGRDAVDAASKAGLLKKNSYTYVKCPDLTDSEIEDIYSPGLYQPCILSEYNVDLSDKKLGKSGVWSDRAKNQFVAQSGEWNSDGTTEMELKSILAEAVAKDPQNALIHYRRRSFDALVSILERRLSSDIEE